MSDTCFLTLEDRSTSLYSYDLVAEAFSLLPDFHPDFKITSSKEDVKSAPLLLIQALHPAQCNHRVSVPSYPILAQSNRQWIHNSNHRKRSLIISSSFRSVSRVLRQGHTGVPALQPDGLTEEMICLHHLLSRWLRLRQRSNERKPFMNRLRRETVLVLPNRYQDLKPEYKGTRAHIAFELLGDFKS